MLRIALIVILVFLLIRMISQAIFAYYIGITRDEPKQSRKKREGEVTIEKINKQQKKISKEDGQYVDYEEVE